MRFRLIDSSGDWIFGRGATSYAQANNAIMLNIQTGLNEWLNDCCWAMKRGIDYYNRLGSTGQKQLLDQDIRRIILNTPGVTQINSLAVNVNTNTRKFSANYNISTIYSQSFINSFVKEF